MHVYLLCMFLIKHASSWIFLSGEYLVWFLMWCLFCSSYLTQAWFSGRVKALLSHPNRILVHSWNLTTPWGISIPQQYAVLYIYTRVHYISIYILYIICAYILSRWVLLLLCTCSAYHYCIFTHTCMHTHAHTGSHSQTREAVGLCDVCPTSQSSYLLHRLSQPASTGSLQHVHHSIRGTALQTPHLVHAICGAPRHPCPHPRSSEA